MSTRDHQSGSGALPHDEEDRFGAPLPEGVTLVGVELDWVSQTMRFMRSDAKEAILPTTLDGEDITRAISKSTYFFPDNLALFETRRGDYLTAHLPTLENPSPIDGRPVIYLDQKDWSLLANTLHEPHRVPARQRAAAESIIGLARERKIILPLSSAHMAETCKWADNDRRYNLALTILQLSNGWQMRDPLAVRRDELHRTFRARYRPPEPAPLDVITLAPGAIHAARLRPWEPSDDSLPEPLKLATKALTSVSSCFTTMLYDDPIPMTPVPGWAQKLQAITDWMATEQRNPERKRGSTDACFLTDTQREVAEEAHRAGTTVEDLHDWMKGPWKDDVAAMPCLSLFREALHDKHVNSTTRWWGNDLVDLMYLSCAAGYADHVVGERSATSILRQGAKRLGRPVQLYRNIQELMSAGNISRL